MLSFLHDIFTVIKFFFGLGALFTLLGMGLLLVWFFLRAIVGYALRGQPADRYVPLRKLFLDAGNHG
jgi:hypothetical protein